MGRASDDRCPASVAGQQLGDGRGRSGWDQGIVTAEQPEAGARQGGQVWAQIAIAQQIES